MKPQPYSIKGAKSEDEILYGWIKATAGITGIIALLVLLILNQKAQAQDPPRGFPQGSGGNPFGNSAPKTPSPSFFEDGEEDEEDFFLDEEDPPSPSDTSRNSGGNSNRADDQSVSAGSMGGSSGVNAKNTTAALKIDSETGEGSKAMVTDFNFPDADILDIAKTLGKLTGKNFILDKDVKGKVTIISNSAITVGDAWRAFLTALDMSGYALIPSGKYIRISRQRDARDKQVKTYVGKFSPDTDALITRVFPLKYINAEEVARTFRSFMPANSRIIPHDQTNTVIVTDSGANITKLQKMLDILDIEGYDAGIEVIPVKYASASELSKLIDTLIPGTGSAPGAAGGPRFGGSTGRFSSRRTKEGGVINTIISDERTNALIIHANSKGADQVKELVAKLDQKQAAQQGGGKVHVIYLQYTDAEALSATLNNLSQSTRTATAPAGAGGGTGVNPVAQSLFEGQIKVSADKATNALVVTGSPADFVTVQRVVSRLDIPRDEVYIDSTIMEVTLDKQFEWSSDVINPASGIGAVTSNNLASFIASPITTTGGVLGFKAGNNMNFDVGGKTVTVSSVTGLIRLIQTNTKSNVLSNPQIIALDNEEALFKSTEKIPIPKTVLGQNGSPNTVTFDPMNVELSLKIKPQINKVVNFVKMEVEVNLGDVLQGRVPEGSAAQAVATQDRTAKTKVVVADGDSIVLGGLVRDKVTDTQSKIPVLGDIPLLGWLFKSKKSQTTKTNLLIFLTPKIIRQYEKVRAILDNKLRERDEFIESASGGEDPHRKERDKMIRSLPDIKEIVNQKPRAAVALDSDDTAGGSDNSPFTGQGETKTPDATSPPANSAGGSEAPATAPLPPTN